MEELPKIVPVLLTLRTRPHGELVIAAVIVYLKTVGKVREEEVRVALQRTVGNSIAEEILFGAERRYERGVRDAKLEGKRDTLKLMLGQRFGVLPPEAVGRIDTGSAGDLDAITLRVLSAATLDEALGTPTNKPS